MTDAKPQPKFITAPLTRRPDAALNGLEQVIEAAMEDPQHWRAFEALLPRVDLYISPEGEAAKEAIAAAGQGGGMRVLRSEDHLELRGIVLEDGRTAAVVFTDPQRLTGLWSDLPIVGMNALALLKLWRDRPVLLNPGSPRAFLFEIEDVAALIAAGEAHAAAGRATAGPVSGKVTLSPPERIPELLLQRLVQAFGPVGGSGVTAAWLARARWEEAGQQGWFLDFRTSRPSDEIRAMVQRALTGVGFGDETLDISVAPSGGADGVGIRFI